MGNLENSGIYRIWHIPSGKSYIGSSSDVFNRFKGHRYSLNKGTHHAAHLQNAWTLYGDLAFGFQVLEMPVPVENLIVREQFWIEHYQAAKRGIGYNTAPVAGSRRGVPQSAECKAKISSKVKGMWIGRPLLPETKAKLSLVRKGTARTIAVAKLGGAALAKLRRGGKLPEHTKAKISATLMGHSVSDETIAKISAALKGRVAPNKGCIGPPSPRKGIKSPLATVEKLKSYLRNRSPEQVSTWKEKLSIALTGKIQSPETIEKRRLSCLAYRLRKSQQKVEMI